MKKRKDGRYQKIITKDGHRIYFYAYSISDLNRQVAEYQYNDIHDPIRQNNITVYEWAIKWLTTYKTNVQQATYNMYQYAIEKYIKDKIGYIKLKDLQQQDILDLLNSMNNIERQRDIVFLTIKQILNSAIDNELLNKNVAIKIKLKRHKSAPKSQISEEIISKLNNLVLKDEKLFIIQFMLYTGLRREEVVPLQFKDFDVVNKTITIDKAVHFEVNQPTIKSTKNEDVRKVPILDIIYPELLTLYMAHNEDDYIFTNRSGQMMSLTSFRKKIEYANKVLDYNFTAHQLRHTYACILHKANVPLKEAQYFMGHKDIRVLMNIYTHLDSEDKLKAVDQLNNTINKSNC